MEVRTQILKIILKRKISASRKAASKLALIPQPVVELDLRNVSQIDLANQELSEVQEEVQEESKEIHEVDDKADDSEDLEQIQEQSANILLHQSTE